MTDLKSLFSFPAEGRDDMWRIYYNRRVGSLIRLLFVNILVLIATMFVLVYIHDDLAHESVSKMLVAWFISSLLALLYIFTIAVLLPAAAVEKYQWNTVDNWNRIGFFIFSLRCYHLLDMVMEILELKYYGYLTCHEDLKYGAIMPAVHQITDHGQMLVWMSVVFSSPWNFCFILVESASTLIRIYSCRKFIADYINVKESFYLLVIPLYFFQLLFHWILENCYKRHTLQSQRLNALSAKVGKSMHTANKNMKLALQFVSGSLTKLKNFDATASQMINRNIQHMTLLIDDVVLLSKMEEDSYRQTTSAPIDWGETVSDILNSLRDPSVPKVYSLTVTNFSKQKAPNPLCSNGMIHKIISNFVLYAMTSIRRRSFRQRVGYTPHIYVTGFVLENHEDFFFHHQKPGLFASFRWLLSSWFSMKSVANRKRKGSHQVLRLVIDFNGDVAEAVADEPSQWIIGRALYYGVNLYKRLIYRENANNRGEKFDGKEIFADVENLNVPDNVKNNDKIFSMREVAVASSRELYAIDSRTPSSSSLPNSPLSLITMAALIKDCGGRYAIDDFVVTSDEPSIRKLQFNRIVIDLPCIERSSATTNPGSLKSQSKPIGGRKSSRADIIEKDLAIQSAALRVAVIISEKRISASVVEVLRECQVPFAVFNVKKSYFAHSALDIANILNGKFTVAFFDLENIGVELRERGFTGERIFFTPSSIFLDNDIRNHPAYEHVLPIPCQQLIVTQFIATKMAHPTSVYNSAGLGRETAVVESEDSTTVFGVAMKYVLLSFEFLNDLSLFSAFFTLMKGLLSILKTIEGFLFWLFLERLDLPLASLDSMFYKSNKVADEKDDLPTFSSRFGFRGAMFGMPHFRRGIERKFLLWRMYNVDGGLLSHSSTFMFCLLLVFLARYLDFQIWKKEDLYMLNYPLHDVFYVVQSLWFAVVIILRFFMKEVPGRFYLWQGVALLRLLIDTSLTIVIVLGLYNTVDFTDENHVRVGAAFVGSLLSKTNRQAVIPYITFAWRINWLNTVVLLLRQVIIAAVLIRKTQISIILLWTILLSILIAVYSSFLRVYELEYVRRIEFQTLNWYRFRSTFVESCRSLCWSDMRYPLKNLLKLKKSTLDAISNLIITKGTDYLSEGYDAARALNLGWIKLEKMNSILGLAAVCGSESILQLKYSTMLVREEVAHISNIIEMDCGKLMTEISIMIHPALYRIQVDREVFRMLLITAILSAIENIEAMYLPSSENGGTRFVSGEDEVTAKNLVREILVQVGIAKKSRGKSIDTIIESKMIFEFLEDDDNNNQNASEESEEASSLEQMMMVAIVDNGISRREPHPDNDDESVCRNVVENCLKGKYEKKNLGPRSLFTNMTRYTVPFRPDAIDGNEARPPQNLWMTPSVDVYSAFERPSIRYEHMKMLHASRKAQFNKNDKTQSTRFEDSGSEITTGIEMTLILVHQDTNNMGQNYANTFRMHSWNCIVVPDMITALYSPNLYYVDALVICSSVLSEQESSYLLPLEELSYRGFYGSLFCLIDGFEPVKNNVNNAYESIYLPLLDSNVQRVSDLSEKAFIDYLIGASYKYDE